jgi:Ca-activated chloride channel family protein
MSFHQPSVWWLLLLPLALLPWLPVLRPGRRPALAFSGLATLRRAGTTWAVRARHLVPVLRSGAILLLVVCLARPRLPDETTRVFGEGIAIELVIDRSGSMRETDFRVDGRPAARLDVVKRVVEQFVAGDAALPGRPGDLMGLIAFATFADSRCPLTLDHDHLIQTVRAVEPATTQEEGQTAIGDALALAVERLQSLDRDPGLATRGDIRSRVIILLTDGESNAGDIDPMTAARLAASFGIKVYTIGAGSDAPRNPMDLLGGLRRGAGLDEATLRAIAQATGAQYFRATDAETLRSVYRQIDELERARFEQRRYLQFTEAAVAPVPLGGFRLPPLLALVFGLLALEILLAHTRLQTLP